MFDHLMLYVWRSWVDLFSGLGLPWDKQTTGLMFLCIALYAIGRGFKALVEK